MTCQINARRSGAVTVVDISGRLTIGDPALLLRNIIGKSLGEGNVRFVLNLAGVDYLDSSGLGELVTTLTTVRKQQGDVKLLNPSGRIKDLLRMTKLQSVFDIYDDEQKAVTAVTSTAAHG